MTTIAFDGRYFAADTRATAKLTDDYKHSCPKCESTITRTHTLASKLLVPEKTIVINKSPVIVMGIVGSEKIGVFMMKMFVNNDKAMEAIKAAPISAEDNATKLIMLTEQHLLHATTDGKLFESTKVPYAFGSGAQAARVAMNSGSTAMEAIRIAATVDTSTNDRVDYVKIVPSERFVIERYKHDNTGS